MIACFHNWIWSVELTFAIAGSNYMFLVKETLLTLVYPGLT